MLGAQKNVGTWVKKGAHADTGQKRPGVWEERGEDDILSRDRGLGDISKQEG